METWMSSYEPHQQVTGTCEREVSASCPESKEGRGGLVRCWRKETSSRKSPLVWGKTDRREGRTRGFPMQTRVIAIVKRSRREGVVGGGK